MGVVAGQSTSPEQCAHGEAAWQPVGEVVRGEQQARGWGKGVVEHHLGLLEVFEEEVEVGDSCRCMVVVVVACFQADSRNGGRNSTKFDQLPAQKCNSFNTRGACIIVGLCICFLFAYVYNKQV